MRQIYAPRTRGPKGYETFAKLFPSKVAAAHNDWDEETDQEKKTTALGKWHTICKNLYSNATDSELQAVEEKMAQTAKEAKDEDEEVDVEDFTPVMYQKYVLY